MSKLWIVVDNDRWGHSTNVVRAATKEDALEFVLPGYRDRLKPPGNLWSGGVNLNLIHVEELREGHGILWCEDDSPDTPPDT